MRKRGLIICMICLVFSFLLHAQEEKLEAYEYIFPGPGAKYVHPGSSIILRFKNLSQVELMELESLIMVRGEESGEHSGKTIIASDNRTLIFKPEKSFVSGEDVKVTVTPRFSEFNVNPVEPLNYEFTVLKQAVSKISHQEELSSDLWEHKKKSAGSYQPMIMSNGVSVPADFPHVYIANEINPSSDYVFINTWDPPYYSIIFDTSGDPVWYMKTTERRNDLKVQANGWITMMIEDDMGGSGTRFIALDQNFDFIKSMSAANGYLTDEHDLYMLPDNGYILIGQRETIVDMSAYVSGGQTHAIVRETCIQEFTADDQLIFIWRSWDHFDILDMELESLTGNYIRFPHINAVFPDEDGHILISSRHLSEISKIHRQSGDFIWRLSGIPESPNNDFLFIYDPLDGFRNQHAIRSLGDNSYMLFDNGNMHEPAVSRVVEYDIDTLNMTAALTWEHRSVYDRTFIGFLGNTQRLSNGNTHVNWAYGNILPIATEVTPNGDIVFEMWFDKGERCYRSFRHPWVGVCTVPYLLLEPRADNLILLMNKFGDDDVAYYNIYGGTNPNPLSLIDTSRTSLKRLTNLENGRHYYFRVTAVDQYGTESGFSNEENLIIRDLAPGSNLIINGNFTDGLDSWILEVDSLASAEVQISDSVCSFEIPQGGSNVTDVQLRQNNIPLIQGQNYILEFDGWADETRIVEVMVGMDISPFTNYSRNGYTAVNSGSERYTYSFEMQESTDLNARLAINAGTSTEHLYLDNISLRMDVQSSSSDPYPAASEFTLYPNYPNPFSSSTTIAYFLPQASHVKLSIYNMLGQLLKTFIFNDQTAGMQSQEIQLGHLSSGVYYYSLDVKALHSATRYQETNRMILIK